MNLHSIHRDDTINAVVIPDIVPDEDPLSIDRMKHPASFCLHFSRRSYQFTFERSVCC